MNNDQRNFWIVAVIVGFPIIVALLVGAAYVASKDSVDAVFRLPVLLITGIVVLLAVLSIMTMIFSLHGLADKKQALGLPNGSVRAVIALSLIVLLGILAVYFYGSMSDKAASVTSVSGLSDTAAKSFVAALPPGELVNDQRDPPLAVDGASAPVTADSTQGGTPGVQTGPAQQPSALPAAAPPVTAPPVTAPPATHTVYFRVGNDPAKVDFAKQLMTLLGTLVTAVASFYFGSKAAAPPAPADNVPVPAPTAVTPTAGKLGDPVDMSVTGTNLGTIDKVLLRLGTAEIPGAHVMSNATKVTFSIAIPLGVKPGKWDIVTSAKGTEYILPTAFDIS